MDRKKKSIGLSGFFGFINLIIGVPAYFRTGLLAWGTSQFFTRTIGMIFIPSGILAVAGALFEFKSLIIGSTLCLDGGIFHIVVSITLNYTYYPILHMLTFFVLIPSLFIIIGGILGLWEYYKPSKKSS